MSIVYHLTCGFSIWKNTLLSPLEEVDLFVSVVKSLRPGDRPTHSSSVFFGRSRKVKKDNSDLKG